MGQLVKVIMSSTFKLVIHSADMNAISGYYTVTASIEERTDDGNVVVSPRETFGVSHEEIHQRFGGDIVKWRDTVVAPTLKSHHVIRRDIHSEIIGWQGKSFPV